MDTTFYTTLFVLGVIPLSVVIYAYYVSRKKKSLTADVVIGKNTQKVNTGKKIFISYRREDSSGYSLALYNELLKWYDRNNIFKDFNNIEPGEDFEEAIDNALNSCDILLVIISDNWMELLRQRQSQARQQDFVTLEIAKALSKNIYTIPITFNGALMPRVDDLPDELKKLIRKQYLDIDQTRFESDILKLVHIIDKKFGIQRNFK